MAQILMLSPELPYPPTSGGRSRTYNLIRVGAKKHRYVLVTFRFVDSEIASASKLMEECPNIEVITVPRVRPSPTRRLLNRARFWMRMPLGIYLYVDDNLKRCIAEVSSRNRFDLLQVEHLYMAQYAAILPRSLPKLLNAHNIESSRLGRIWDAQKGNPVAKARDAVKRCRLKRFESHLGRLFAAAVCVSEDDARQLRRMNPKLKVYTAPNGVDAEYFQPKETESTWLSMVFTGTMSYPSNVDAATHFAREILPLLARNAPDAHFWVVGSSPLPELIDLGKTNRHITVTGYVEDIRPYIADATVYVVPLRSGGGTRLKILEALAMARPVVSTSMGCEGLEVEHSKNIIIADDPSDFAAWILELWANPELRRELGANGRRLIEEKYRWEVIGERMERVYAQFTGLER